MDEIWKPIKDYEGLYEVSNMGRVRSLDRMRWGGSRAGMCLIKGIVLTPRPIWNNYLTVNLCKNGVQKNYLIHRLVAEAHIPNPDNLPQVNHKDENRQNNIVSNLEWCDGKYNMNYGNCQRSKSKPILCYTTTGEFVTEYKSATEAARAVGSTHHETIARVARGERRTSYGYVWKYKNDEKLGNTTGNSDAEPIK